MMTHRRTTYLFVCAFLVPVFILSGVTEALADDGMEAVRQGPRSTRVTESSDSDVSSPASSGDSGSSVDRSREQGSWSYWAKGFWKYLSRTVKSVFGGGSSSSEPNAWVTADSLNVRSGPGGSNSKVGRVSYGSQIEILEEKNGWYRVEHGTTKGWVCGRYVQKLEEEKEDDKPGFFSRLFGGGGSDDEEDTSSDNTGTVTASRLNVRSGPGSSNDKVGSLSRGEKLTILAKDGIWYKVKCGDTEGWVHGNYVNTGVPVLDGSSKRKPPTGSNVDVFVDVEPRTQFSLANGKMGAYWCGPTSLAQVYEYYGRKESTAEVAHRTYDFEGGTGTSGAALVADARKNGFPNAKMRYNVGFDYIEKSLKKGNPVIIGTEVNWTNGHYLVVVGIKGDKVIIHDSARPFFCQREVSKAWLLTQWNGRWRRAITLK